MLSYCISIVLAFSCGRAKKIPIHYFWTRIFSKTEEKNIRFQICSDTCGRALRITFSKSLHRENRHSHLRKFKRVTPPPPLFPRERSLAIIRSPLDCASETTKSTSVLLSWQPNSWIYVNIRRKLSRTPTDTPGMYELKLAHILLAECSRRIVGIFVLFWKYCKRDSLAGRSYEV